MSTKTKIEEVELPPDYRPSADEPYMNPRQLAYFRRKLLDWRESLLEEAQQTINHLRDEGEGRIVGDEADRATQESDNILELRTRDRYRKLLPKIDAALRRIDDGSYGFCEETGEEIGLQRLDARPVATLSVEAQERREKRQTQYSDEH
jgi:DnaK suppressor protein